jgi:prepilin-type processing-associated H-X9-DG protein
VRYIFKDSAGVVAYDAVPHASSDTRNVVFADGRVETVAESDWQRFSAVYNLQ